VPTPDGDAPREGVLPAEAVAGAVPVGVGDAGMVGEDEGESRLAPPLPETLGDAEGEGEGARETVLVTETLGDPLREPLWEGLPDTEAEGERVRERGGEADPRGVPDEEGEGVGEDEGGGDREAEGERSGDDDADCDAAGEREMRGVGESAPEGVPSSLEGVGAGERDREGGDEKEAVALPPEGAGARLKDPTTLLLALIRADAEEEWKAEGEGDTSGDPEVAGRAVGGGVSEGAEGVAVGGAPVGVPLRRAEPLGVFSLLGESRGEGDALALPLPHGKDEAVGDAQAVPKGVGDAEARTGVGVANRDGVAKLVPCAEGVATAPEGEARALPLSMAEGVAEREGAGEAVIVAQVVGEGVTALEREGEVVSLSVADATALGEATPLAEEVAHKELPTVAEGGAECEPKAPVAVPAIRGEGVGEYERAADDVAQPDRVLPPGTPEVVEEPLLQTVWKTLADAASVKDPLKEPPRGGDALPLADKQCDGRVEMLPEMHPESECAVLALIVLVPEPLPPPAL
jgi:hypothetical protein